MVIIGPERLVFPLMILLICLLIWYIQYGHENKYLMILTGIVISFCVMQKLTMLPLIILPFFIIRKKSEIIAYTGTVTLTIFLLSTPIMSHYRRMYEFFKGAAGHSGIYGSGKAQFIDWSTVIPNLSAMFKDMQLPMYCLILLVVFIPITYLLRRKQSETIQRIRRLIYGVAVAELLILFFVIKHFKSHYFAPVAALSFFNVYLCFEYLRQSLFLNRKIMSSILAVLLFMIPVFNYANIKSLFGYFSKADDIRKTLNQIEVCYHNYPTIFIPRYYGCPYVEYSIMAGYYYSYNNKQYGPKLKEMYPKSYYYTSDWGTYDMGYDGHKTAEVLLQYDKIILSYFHDDTLNVNSFFREVNETNRKYTFKETIFNESEKYVIGEIQFSQDSLSLDPL